MILLLLFLLVNGNSIGIGLIFFFVNFGTLLQYLLFPTVPFAPQTLIITTSATETSKADWTEMFMSKLLPGIGLTLLHYLKKNGTQYQPIEKEVTYWCIKP